MKSLLLSTVFALSTALVFSTTIKITDSGFTFSPDSINITVGDTVFFDITSSHNAIEVSQTTWTNNGNTPLSGGFQTSYGGGSVFPVQLTVGTHYYVCSPHASMGMKGIIVVQGCTPATPDSIRGNNKICSSISTTFRIKTVSGATSYTWTLPSGWSGTSTIDSIIATAGSTGGDITVTANNTCGSSAAKSLSVTVNSAPSTPGTISGNTTICSGSLNNYSITAVNGATSYTWTLPSGWSGSSTTNSISTTASSSGGNITVKANNSCGSSAVKTLALTVNSIPATPLSIIGDTNICSGTSNTFSITTVNGATSYTWTLPSGWSGISTKDSITTTAGNSGGKISVTANNSCGSSAAQSLSITAFSKPGSPGFISGDTIVCKSSSQTYSITSVNAATSYSWTLPSGWSGSSASNSISATVGNSSGSILVTANNFCGSSKAKSLSVTVNTSAPVISGTITGDTIVCDSSLNNYSIAAVNDATSYSWTFPNDWTGSSTTNSISTVVKKTSGNITVTANNSCGSSATKFIHVTISGGSALPQPGTINGDTSICMGSTNLYSIKPVNGATSYNWTLPDGWTGSSDSNSITTTANSTIGTITVSAQNHCGLSAPQTITILVKVAPILTDSIIGNNTVCAASLNTYSITAVNGATSYTWTLPSGWSGNSTSNLINATANSLSGNISVAANNTCGSSAVQFLSVKTNTINTSVTQSEGILKANDSGALYQWIDCTNNRPVSGESSQIFNATVSGSYAVIITKNGCSDTSSCYEIIINGISKSTSITEITVYPNPFVNKINSANSTGKENYELRNQMGQLLWLGKNIENENFSTLSSGIYFLKVKSEQTLNTIKLIKH